MSYSPGKVRNHAYGQFFGRTSLSLTGALRSANRTDWARICSGTYRSELVTLYKHSGLAQRGVSFVAAVSSGQLSPMGKEIGVLEAFRTKVIVTDRNSLAGAVGHRAWESKRRFKKIMINVDPHDDHWLVRFVRKILKHYESNHSLHSRLSVELYEKGAEKRLSSEGRVLMGQLMANPSREIYAIVVESSTVQDRPVPPEYVRRTLKKREEPAAKPVEQPVLSKAAARRAKRKERMIKAPLQSQHKEVTLKMPEKPLEGLSNIISERISSELYESASETYRKSLETGNHKSARSAVDALIADPMFVAHSVAKAMTDDSIYSKVDASTPTAAAYWSKRGANIGDMINTVSTSISRSVTDMNASAMFKPVDMKTKLAHDTGKALPIGDDQNARVGKPFNGDIAKKAFSDATIGCGIWDSFKDWLSCGINACGDNGGPDFGPTTSFCGNHYRFAPFHGHCDSLLPRVHCVPHRCHDDKNVIKQKVVLRIHGARRKAKKHHNHGVVAVGGVPHVVAVPVAGEDSDSSGDEEVSYDRAMRKHHGLAYRNVHSDGEEDDDDNDEDEFLPSAVVVKEKVATTVTATTDYGYGHIDQVKYSNFLSLVKESGHLNDTRPYVLLALDNGLLTANNMAKIRASKEGVKGFISRYMVHCHSDARDLHHSCFRHPTLLGGALLVSAAGVHFAAHTVATGARLVLAAGAALGHATLHAVHFLTCPVLPGHVRFLPFHYLHHHFPKHGHTHVYAPRLLSAHISHFDSPHVDI